jgi:hypothetical protein
MYFIGLLDAGMILGRFGTSVIVCRAVVIYKLASMRVTQKLEKPKVVKKTSVVDLEKKGAVINRRFQLLKIFLAHGLLTSSKRERPRELLAAPQHCRSHRSVLNSGV